jgi:hydrogenase nickel incorporation protein HypA/HybF
MHELSIAGNILDIVAQHVPGERAAAVRAVKVRVGMLSGVVPDSLEFAFDAIVAGTAWGSAKLEIERREATGKCLRCSTEFPLEEPRFACPSCGDPGICVISGMELDIVEVVLAEEPAEVP